MRPASGVRATDPSRFQGGCRCCCDVVGLWRQSFLFTSSATGPSQVLGEELSWLNYFPAGFKLNVPLTFTLGSGALVAIELFASLLASLAPWQVGHYPSLDDVRRSMIP